MSVTRILCPGGCGFAIAWCTCEKVQMYYIIDEFGVLYDGTYSGTGTLESAMSFDSHDEAFDYLFQNLSVERWLVMPFTSEKATPTESELDGI